MAARTPEVKINGKVLAKARKSLGMNPDVAAKKLGVERSTLDDWENEVSKPSYSKLRTISKVFKRPSAYFLLKEESKEPKLPTDFRVIDGKSISYVPGELLLEIRKVRRRRSIALELLEDLDQKSSKFTGKATLEDDPEKVGLKVRKILKVSDSEIDDLSSESQPYQFWKSKIEDYGVLVFQVKLGDIREIRGLALYESVLPIILINSADSNKAKTFTLLHEFGHLLLNTSGICNPLATSTTTDGYNKIEIFCNAVAGATLVPESQLLSFVDRLNTNRGWDEYNIRRVSKRFFVSHEVVTRRLLKFKAVSPNFYRKKIMEYTEKFKNWKPKKSKGFVPLADKMFSQNGAKFTSLVLTGYRKDVITAADVSEYLGVKVRHLEKMTENVTSYFGKYKGSGK